MATVDIGPGQILIGQADRASATTRSGIVRLRTARYHHEDNRGDDDQQYRPVSGPHRCLGTP